MRPMLTWRAQACSNIRKPHQKLAASSIHPHRDPASRRRWSTGRERAAAKRTANLIWGNPASGLFGDSCSAVAFELMVEDGSLKVLRILSHASAVIAEGEVEQLTAQRRIGTGEEQYLEIIGAKTAALFAAACRIAPVVAEAGEDSETALESYGRNLGIAFQLVDDVIDYASDSATWARASATIFATAR